MPTPSPSQAAPPPAESNRGDRARERLIDAAMEIFSERNLEGARTREIAAAAEQNVASISYYFGSKEGLYHAVFERIASDLRQTMGAQIKEIEQLHAAHAITRPLAVSLLKRLMRTLYIHVRTKDSQGNGGVGRLIVREQIAPTPAFDIVYERAIRVVHETTAILVAAYLEADPKDPIIIIRTHALLGQLLVFVTARETIRRRLGLPPFGKLPPETEHRVRDTIARILEEQAEAQLVGLAACNFPTIASPDALHRVISPIQQDPT